MIIVKNRELLIPRNEQYIGTPNDNNADNRVFRISRLSQTGEDLSGLTYRLDLLYPDKRNVYTVSAVTSRSGRGVVVLTTLFARQYPASGTYTFSFDGTNWKHNNQNVTLSEVGIIIAYNPVSGDTVTVTSTIQQVITDTVLLSKEITDEYINLTWTVTAAQLAIPGTVYVTLRGANDDAEVRWASFQGAFYVEQNNYTPAMFTGPMSELEYFEQVLSSNLAKLEYLPTKYEELEDAVEDAEAWAKGTRSGSEVPEGDDTYHNNSKYYSEQANASKNAAAASQSAAAASASQAAQIVPDLMNKKIQRYDTLTQMVADTALASGMYVRTGGNTALNDGGGAIYRIDDTPSQSAINVQLDNGLYAEMIASLMELYNHSTTSDFAKTWITEVAMSYVRRRSEFSYDDDHDLYHGDGAKVDGKWQCGCSGFVMAVINGVTFENSKYNGKPNIENGLGMCSDELTEYFTSDLDKPEEEWKFSQHLAEWLFQRGYCFKPNDDLSNLQTGDIMFYSLEQGTELEPTVFKGINHSAIFNRVENDGIYSVFEVGSIPTLAKYPFTYLQRNHLVLVARPAYKNFSLPAVKNLAYDSTVVKTGTGSEYVPCMETLKAGKTYTLRFSCVYPDNESAGKVVAYPAILDDGAVNLLNNDYGAATHSNEYIYVLTPTVDMTTFVIQTRTTDGRTASHTMTNFAVYEGSRAQMPFIKSFNRDVFTKAIASAAVSHYQFSDIETELYVDIPNPERLQNVVVGTISNIRSPIVQVPVQAIAFSETWGAFATTAWVNSARELCYKINRITVHSGDEVIEVQDFTHLYIVCKMLRA